MNPPIVSLAKQNPALEPLLGDDPFRFYAFGDAGSNKTYPYATWQIIGGTPENYLAGRPDSDSISLQIDCWAKTEIDAEQVAKGIRYAIELNAYVTSINGTWRDPVTRNYRYSFSADFFVDR